MPDGPLTGGPRLALFGKLPAHGDFVRRGDGALVRRLDTWLTGEVERLALTADDMLDARLDTLPTWCFRLPGDMAGAIAASRDKVGRIFPVVACAGLDVAAAERTGAVLRRARDGEFSADLIARELQEIMDAPFDPLALDGDETIDARWWTMDSPDEAVLALPDLPTGADFARLLQPQER